MRLVLPGALWLTGISIKWGFTEHQSNQTQTCVQLLALLLLTLASKLDLKGKQWNIQ